MLTVWSWGIINFQEIVAAQSLPQNLEVERKDFDRLERIKIEQIKIVGNTVLRNEIAEIINSYLEKDLELNQIAEIVDNIVKLYQENGYITSGAIINKIDLDRGLVEIKVIEGKLESLEINGLKRLNPNYIKQRILNRVKTPVQFFKVEETRRLLIFDPLLEDVQFEIKAGVNPASSRIIVEAKEAKTFLTTFVVSNDQSPVIGEWQGQANIANLNLLGNGEILELDFKRTLETNTFKISGCIPINDRDGKWEFTYEKGLSSVILTPLDEVNLRVNSEVFLTRIRQPIVKNLFQELILSSELYIGNNQNLILEDILLGESEYFIFRVSQDYIQNLPTWKARFRINSEFSVGSANTTNDSLDPIDPNFILVRIQTQYLQEFFENNNLLLNVRLVGQYTPNSLVSTERLALGGFLAGRGYERDIVRGDNAIFGSFELSYKIAEGNKWGQLYVVGFSDVGAVFNNNPSFDINPQNAIASLGVGLVLELDNGLKVELYGAKPLIRIDSPNNSLAGDGFSGRITYTRRF